MNETRETATDGERRMSVTSEDGAAMLASEWAHPQKNCLQGIGAAAGRAEQRQHMNWRILRIDERRQGKGASRQGVAREPRGSKIQQNRKQ